MGIGVCLDLMGFLLGNSNCGMTRIGLGQTCVDRDPLFVRDFKEIIQTQQNQYVFVFFFC